MLIELIIILILIVLILWTIKINLQNKWNNLPPGPIQFPIVGHLIQLGVMTIFNSCTLNTFKKWSLENGRVSSLKFGGLLSVLLDDIETMKEVFSSDIWTDRHFNILYGLRTFGKPQGLLFSSGDEWKEMRRFTQRTLRDFGFGKHKDQETILHEEIHELCMILDSKIDDDKKLGTKESIICTEQLFTISILNNMWSFLAGERFSYHDTKLKRMNYVLAQITKDNSIGASIFHAYPSRFSCYLMTTFATNGRRAKKYIPQIQKFFQDILDERRSLGFYKTDQKDFIDVILMEIDNHKTNGPSETTTNYYIDDQFVILLWDLFHAGSETISFTLEFAILYMILHPNVQKKVQEEIDNVIGPNRSPSYILDRAKMPYTEATLHEIQRMGSILPIDSRTANQDTMLEGYFIPKGTPVVINLHSVQYNEKIWGDPYVFRPERFLDEQNNIVNTNKMLPFAGGKRACPGEVLAKATLFIYFISFLQKYNFSQVPNKPTPTMKPKIGLTLSPQKYDVVISYR